MPKGFKNKYKTPLIIRPNSATVWDKDMYDTFLESSEHFHMEHNGPFTTKRHQVQSVSIAKAVINFTYKVYQIEKFIIFTLVHQSASNLLQTFILHR